MDFYLIEGLNHSNITFGMSHANSIDFNIGSQYNVKWNIFGLIEYPNNNVLMNKMEQEEQEEEYINAFDFINNF